MEIRSASHKSDVRTHRSRQFFVLFFFCWLWFWKRRSGNPRHIQKRNTFRVFEIQSVKTLSITVQIQTSGLKIHKNDNNKRFQYFPVSVEANKKMKIKIGWSAQHCAICENYTTEFTAFINNKCTCILYVSVVSICLAERLLFVLFGIFQKAKKMSWIVLFCCCLCRSKRIYRLHRCKHTHINTKYRSSTNAVCQWDKLYRILKMLCIKCCSCSK